MGETPAAADETLQSAEADAEPPPASPATATATATGDGDEPGPGPRPRPVAWAKARVLVPAYTLLAVALTWPLSLHITDYLAYGSEPTTTVPLFNLWTLRWNQDRLAHGLSGYWDAPLFHPATGNFALSEPQPLTGLVFAPISWVTGNPVLAFNLVALAIFVLNGWFGARLARHFGVAAAPAALTGALAMGLPFVASQMGVLQLTVIFPLLGLVDAVIRWAPEGGRKRAAEIGAWLAVTFLTCGYYGLFALVGILPPAVVLARRNWFRWSRVADAAVAALCFAPAIPFLVGQAHLTAHFDRSEETIRALSANVSDLFELTGDALGAGILPWVRDGGDDLAIYSGTALLIVGIAGGVVLRRQSGERLRLFAYLVIGAVLTTLLSLGLNLRVFGFEPYQAIRHVVPGYHSLRSPFRFVALTEVFLVGLAAFGLEDLWLWRPQPVLERDTDEDEKDADRAAEAGPPAPAEPADPTDPGGWARRVGVLAAVAVVVLGVIEVSLAPVELFRVDQADADWVTWLDHHQPPTSPRGTGDQDQQVVAFLPFPVSGRARSYAPTARNMLQVLNAGDGVTTVNGYSGLWPDTYEELEGAAINYPTDQADTLFRQYGVTLLVVDAGWLAERPDAEEWLGDRYVVEHTGPDHVVYSVPPTNGSVSLG